MTDLDRLRGALERYDFQLENGLLAVADPVVFDAARRFLHLAEPGGHAFLPVRGHPDDDECTFRPDGTDDTYCGLPESDHTEETA